MEDSMRKALPGIVILGMLLMPLSVQWLMPETEAAMSKPAETLSVEDIQRTIDIKTLPVQRIEDPV